MWKYETLKLALCILLKTPAYVACSQERLRVLLERSFVPDLEKFSIFVNNTMIEDIILIEGIVIDDHTKENFTAPCYIPRYVVNLSGRYTVICNVSKDRTKNNLGEELHRRVECHGNSQTLGDTFERSRSGRYHGS